MLGAQELSRHSARKEKRWVDPYSRTNLVMLLLEDCYPKTETSTSEDCETQLKLNKPRTKSCRTKRELEESEFKHKLCLPHLSFPRLSGLGIPQYWRDEPGHERNPLDSKANYDEERCRREDWRAGMNTMPGQRPPLPKDIYLRHIAPFLRFEQPVSVLYALGGRQGDPQTPAGMLNSVEMFDNYTKTWTSVLPMSVNRVGAAGGPFGDPAQGHIIVAGGYCRTPGQPMATTEVFNPGGGPRGTGQWTARAPMNQPRFGLALVRTANGFIYAIGGSSGQEITRVVERYNGNPDGEDRWERCAPMPEPLAGGRAVATDCGRYILYVGGFSPGHRLSDRIYIFNSDTQTWIQSVHRLTIPRTVFAMALDNERRKIVLAGGQASNLQNLNGGEIGVCNHVEEVCLDAVFGEMPTLTKNVQKRNRVVSFPPTLPSKRTGCMGAYVKDIGFMVLGGEVEGGCGFLPVPPCKRRPDTRWNEAMRLKLKNEALSGEEGEWDNNLVQPREDRVAFALVSAMAYPRNIVYR